jgi:tetratricopeptide (TPR) repeat protein
VHVGCAVRAGQADEASWQRCPTCRQDWTGKLQLQLCRERCRLASGRPEGHKERLDAGTCLVVALSSNDMPVEALKLGRTNVAAHRRAHHDEHPDTIGAMAALAEALSELQDHAAALVLLTEIVSVQQRQLESVQLAREGPGATWWMQTRQLDAIRRVANTHDQMGNHQLALPLHHEVLEAHSKTAEDADDIDVLHSRSGLAGCHALMGDHQLALPIYMDVLERDRRVLGNEHPNTLTDVGNCAETLCKLGDHAAAVPLFREAVAGMAAVLGDESVGARYWRRWADCNARGECGPNFEAFKAEQETMYERRAKRSRRGAH